MTDERATRVLIAEDDLPSALLLARAIEKRGWTVVVTHTGKQALERLARESFDALVTDWMMPELDGMELVRRIRNELPTPPVIMVVTSVDSPWARSHALDLGADDYVTKPYLPAQVLEQLRLCLARHKQEPAVTPPLPAPVVTPVREAPFVGVVMAASTGGPEALSGTVRALHRTERAAFFIVQHGPAWMLEAFAERLRRLTPMPVHLVTERVAITPGQVYLAPGAHHMVINASGLAVEITDAPPENFVRPAADPLFRSAAAALGCACLGVVMTGLGRDGTAGASHIAAGGGKLIVQKPETCVVASMPRAVMHANLAAEVVAIERLGDAINSTVEAMSVLLRRSRPNR